MPYAQPAVVDRESESRTLRDRTTLKPPVRYGFHHFYEPTSFENAIKCEDRRYWSEAMDKELNSIESHQVWEDYYETPANPLKTTWIFKIKDSCHNAHLKYKARLCVQGFNQIEGLNFDQTYAPTGKAATLRLVLLFALQQNKPIRQFNVQGAFLHAPLEENVFIVTPEGCPRMSPYLKLKKSLYGLKQAPRNWYHTLTSWFESQGFVESDSDPCLYKSVIDDSILFFHVDDMVLVGCGDHFEEKFKTRFENSSAHNPDTILGIEIERTKDSILLSQPNHIKHGLEELGLTNRRGSNCPLTPNLQLKEASDEDHESFKCLNVNFRSAIGLLNYIAMNTRPNISLAVSSLARFSIKPGLQHWGEVKKCWNYLKSTKDMKLTLRVKDAKQGVEIFSDATWADDPKTPTSQSGYICLLFGSPVSWTSCRQRNVTYSSTEAELNPLVDSFQESLWLRAVVSDFWRLEANSPVHHVDDPSLAEALSMSENQFTNLQKNLHFIDNKGLDDKLKKIGTNPKTRNIDLKTKGLRQEIKEGKMKVKLINTKDMLADSLTKAVPPLTLAKLIDVIHPNYHLYLNRFSNGGC